MKLIGALVAVALLQGDKPSFKFDAWEAWNSFAAGANVKHEVETADGKMTILCTIERKSEKVVALHTVTARKVNGQDQSEAKTEEITKPEEPVAEKDRICSLCNKVHKKDVKESKVKLKVGDQDVDCTLVEKTLYDCDGKLSGKWKGWYSKGVPGWLVNMESQIEGTRYTTKCIGFSAKK